MANKLTYKSYNRAFVYEAGDYQLQGQKISQDGIAISSVENGNVRGKGEQIGRFSVSYAEGKPKVSLMDMSLEQMVAVSPIVSALLVDLEK